MDQVTDHASVNVVVCVPTFRRPEWLEQTLKSLSEQSVDFSYAVVVVDNDAENPEGAKVARHFFEQHRIPHAVFIEETQGNCFAINRAFSEAMRQFPNAGFFLMIDDDEVAMPNWLTEMVTTAKREDADVVGGPVIRQFEIKSGTSVQEHQLFRSIDGPTRRVDQLHGSGNCLIRRQVFEKLGFPYFDLRFNFLGGGDMDFFTRCRNAGFITFWNAEAVVHEFVPAERTSAKFLMTRSIRTGSINYMVDRSNGLSSFAAFFKNLVSLGLGIGRSISLLVCTRHLIPASHPLLVSIGRIYAALGFLPEPYKANPKT